MKMAKIINLPTLRKLTEHDREEFLIQLFEMREKLTNVVDPGTDDRFAPAALRRAYGRGIKVGECR
jgi:hypothetical protein